MTEEYPREDLGFVRTGNYHTFVFRIRQDGEYPDLSTWSVLATAKAPDGTLGISPTITKPTQVGKDRGRYYVTFTSTHLSAVRGGTAVPWWMDIVAGPTSGQEQLVGKYSFRQKAKDTEA